MTFMASLWPRLVGNTLTLPLLSFSSPMLYIFTIYYVLFLSLQLDNLSAVFFIMFSARKNKISCESNQKANVLQERNFFVSFQITNKVW